MVLVFKEYDDRVKHFIRNVSFLNSLSPIPKTRKALNLLLEEMSSEKGFIRHDGRDYFVHPIAVAQTALDFGLVKNRIQQKDFETADNILTVSLLHDILEDVDWITQDYLIKEFGYEVFSLIDNVSKRKNEPIEDYLLRVQKHEVSALVKALDRLNNISTLDKSTNQHRYKQLVETRTYYLPFFKYLRKLYIEDRPFYWQTRTIITSILNEIERCLRVEAPEYFSKEETK